MLGIDNAIESTIRRVIAEELDRRLPAVAASGDADELLTLKEAAALAKVAPSTITKWFRLGLKRYGSGRSGRVRRSELLAFRANPPEASPSADASAEELLQHALERRRKR